MIESFSRRVFSGSSGTYNVHALELAAARVRKLKGLDLTVHFLDDSEHVFHVEKRARGGDLLGLVYDHLQLVEKDYFGLQFVADKAGAKPERMVWLDATKTLKKQLCHNQSDLYFKVKFYVSDPSKLHHEYTRYQFYLQIKKDILEERLIVPPSTAILLASYVVQAEIGDYCPEEHHDGQYLSNLHLIPDQNVEYEKKIAELHTLHKGKSPADAEFHFLDHAKRIDLYGVDLHEALDNSNKNIQLGVTHIGLVVFRNGIRLNTFSWSKIMKVSFKRKQFLIQLRREPSEDYDTILLFNMESYRMAKTLWKSCVEHHTFFRLHSPKIKRKFPFSLGSKFSYSGRTEFQTVEEVRKRGKVEHKFVRSPSKQLVKPPLSSSLTEERSKSFISSARPTRDKVTSLGSKEPRKAWGADSQMTEDDDAAGFVFEVPFSPGKVISYADDEDASTSHNGPFDTPPYSASHSPVSQMVVDEAAATVTLHPDDEGKYGFNIRGGNGKENPIVVMKVAPNTPADNCTPRLSEGDQILQINGKDLSDVTYEEAVKLIQEARTIEGGKLVLLVKQNVIYTGLEEYEEPPYQYVPIGDVLRAGTLLEQSMLLLDDGLASGALVARYETLFRKHPDMTTDEAYKPVNVIKNRYRDISPYDATRVVLANSTTDSDYINANFVDMKINGTDTINRYIATQGPLQSTTDDFWQMILEQNCNLIVMLTTLVERGRTKCHKYWPSVGEALDALNYSVRCTKEETDETDSFVFRDFVFKDKETKTERNIKHVQYLVWPDHGVPSSPEEFLTFTDLVRQMRTDDAPVVVHCSAGIGRTGVLVLMETAMCLIEKDEPVYPLEIVKTMREQRAMMIQNASQYRFVCESVQAAYARKMAQDKDKSESG